MSGKTTDERLRHLLREADPAAGDPGLSREEMREMRRTVLTSIPEPWRRWRLVPVLAGAAVAILALALGLALLPGSGSPTAPPREPERVAAGPGGLPVPVLAVPAQPEAPGVRATPESAVAQTAEMPRRRQARRGLSGHRAPPPTPMVIAEAETHQIQFSTPGGTRIIWVLTSEKVSE